MSAYVCIRQHTSAYVSIRQHTSSYVSLLQRAALICIFLSRCLRRESVDAGFWLVGAFGSIRLPLAALFVRSGALQGDLAKAFMQHTLHLSAYVSIRQHTSALDLAKALMQQTLHRGRQLISKACRAKCSNSSRSTRPLPSTSVSAIQFAHSTSVNCRPSFAHPALKLSNSRNPCPCMSRFSKHFLTSPETSSFGTLERSKITNFVGLYDGPR